MDSSKLGNNDICPEGCFCILRYLRIGDIVRWYKNYAQTMLTQGAAITW